MLLRSTNNREENAPAAIFRDRCIAGRRQRHRIPRIYIRSKIETSSRNSMAI